MISIGKRITVRPKKSDTPIYDALTKCVFAFASAGVLPSQLQKLVVSAEVFDALYAEQKHCGECGGDLPWVVLAGVTIHRGT
jgi:hypothetical protein